MVVRLQKSNSSSTRAVRDKGGREGPPRQVASSSVVGMPRWRLPCRGLGETPSTLRVKWCFVACSEVTKDSRLLVGTIQPLPGELGKFGGEGLSLEVTQRRCRVDGNAHFGRTPWSVDARGKAQAVKDRETTRVTDRTDWGRRGSERAAVRRHPSFKVQTRRRRVVGVTGGAEAEVTNLEFLRTYGTFRSASSRA